MTLGIVSVIFSQLKCVKLFIIKQPTNNNALAVAYGGIVFASGEKNKQIKNNIETVTEVRPVFPPARIPAALSQYGLKLYVPNKPPAMLATLVANNPFDSAFPSCFDDRNKPA